MKFRTGLMLFPFAVAVVALVVDADAGFVGTRRALLAGAGGICSAFGSTAGTCAQGNDTRFSAQAVTNALAGTVACADWSSSLTDQSGAGLTFTNKNAKVCQIGNLLFVNVAFTFASTSNTNAAAISLPFTTPNQTYAAVVGGNCNVAVTCFIKTQQNSAVAKFTNTGGASVQNNSLSNLSITFMLIVPAT